MLLMTACLVSVRESINPVRQDRGQCITCFQDDGENRFSDVYFAYFVSSWRRSSFCYYQRIPTVRLVQSKQPAAAEGKRSEQRTERDKRFNRADYKTR